ncbi:bifunctional diguanylate cyclase/phosphodiesterase, partial [Methylibium sp.]|uniref:putative bifunctional diguanylate cyclase/phosphodiesterase n=1 Tax=Methylibium sp. TaxID=2067992 RepID=UPI00182C7DCC
MSAATPAAYEALIAFLYRAPIGLVQATSDGEITMINPMSAQLLMPLAPHGDLLNLFDVLDSVAPQLRELAVAESEPGAVICDGLRVQLTSVGQPAELPSTLAISLLRLDEKTLMCSVSDVTLVVQQEQQRLVSQLRDATRIDSLTLMPNRAVVIERIDGALHKARTDPQYEFAVLFINGDRFNRINVTLGQSAGDELLRLMAARMNGTVRMRDAVGRATDPEQTAARLGGDEFVVVIEGLRSAEDVRAIAQRLIDALCRPYAIDDFPVHSTASMGVVTRAHAAGDANSVLQDASLAMREAKRAGGARYCVFEPRIKESARLRGSLENDLRRALSAGELFVVYQPIVNLADAGVVGIEALVRWRHPKRGVVPPIEFIEIAEETGLICPLGEFVLNESCRQLVTWQRLLGERAPRLLSVNLSRAQLMEPSVTEKVRSALEASGLSAVCLQLEVTESLAAQDQLIQARLHELKALGLTVALDDFGTGYSSLACLHQLPIDVVKIDRSFVSQVESSAHHRVLIEATVRVARSLGMQTVAEGIETEGQAVVLAGLECDKG